MPPCRDQERWTATTTLLLQDGNVLVGTYSGELMLLREESTCKQLLMGDEVRSTEEVGKRVYVGTKLKVVTVDLKSFTKIHQVQTKEWVYAFGKWKADYLILGQFNGFL